MGRKGKIYIYIFNIVQYSGTERSAVVGDEGGGAGNRESSLLGKWEVKSPRIPQLLTPVGMAYNISASYEVFCQFQRKNYVLKVKNRF